MIKSFISVLNNIEVNGKLPIEITPGYKFERANVLQVNKIKELLKERWEYSKFALPYEYRLEKFFDKESGNQKINRLRIPSDEWRYWVISFDDFNIDKSPNIRLAASLIDNDFDFSFNVLGGALKSSNSPNMFFSSHAISPIIAEYLTCEYFHCLPPTIIESSELQIISKLYHQIVEVKKKHKLMERALKRWERLRVQPQYSDLMIIGLFSVIECLITYKPNMDKDPSLTKQVTTNMLEIEQHFDSKVDHADYFDLSDKEKLWKGLYEYRSRIVHGNQTVFTGNIRHLKNRTAVTEFLIGIVKRLLRATLIDPSLLNSYKKR